jgi:hypothetical protein
MTPDALRATLTAANSRGTFLLDAKALAWPSVGAALQNLLGGTMLQLNAATLQTTAGGGTVTGTLATAPVSIWTFLAGMRVTAAFTCDAKQVVQVALALSPVASGWTPSAMVPSWAASETDAFDWSNVAFVFDTTVGTGLPSGFPAGYGLQTDDPTIVAALRKGMRLSATLVHTSQTDGLAPLLGSAPIAVSGPIEWLGGVPRMDLASGVLSTVQVGGFALPIALHLVATLQCAPGASYDPSKTISQIQCAITGAMQRQVGGKTLLIPFAIAVDPGTQSMAVEADFAHASALAIADVAQLLGVAGTSFDGLQSTNFPALGGLALNRIVLLAGLSPPSLSSAAATLAFTPPGGPWKPFGDLFAFDGMQATFTLNGPVASPSFAVDIGATVTLAGGSLMSTLSLPSAAFSCVLAPDGPALDLSQTIGAITGGILGDLKLACDPLNVMASPKDGTYRFVAAIGDDWSVPIAGKSFALSSVGFDISHAAAATPATTGTIAGNVVLAGVPIRISGDLPAATTDGWTLSGGFTTGHDIALDALVADITAKLGFALPVALPQIDVNYMTMTANTATGDVQFEGIATISLLDTDVRIDVSIARQGKPASTAFTGLVTIGGAGFEIDFTTGAPDQLLVAQWSDAANPLDLGAVASFLGLDISAVPAAFIPDITEASISYNIAKHELVLTVATEHVGLVLASLADPQDGPPLHAMLIQLNATVGLSDLPVIGCKLADFENVSLSGLQVALVPSGSLSAQDAVRVNGAIPKLPAGLPSFPADGLSDKLTLIAKLALGTDESDLTLALASAAPSTSAPSVAATAPAASDASPTAWLTVQKSFGPVTIQRLGLSFHDGRLWLLFDAGFVISALSIDLLGLGLGFTPSFPPSIAPTISGLGVAYSGGPVTIGGGLAVTTNANGEREYDGQLTLSAADFEISALASYTTIAGEASLFAFAFLDAPLGGPAFFYVTGVAAALGVNRDLLIPSADKLSSFPLIAAVMGNSPFAGKIDPAGALSVLADDVPPLYGESWVGLGLRFTTFELLKSFALATLKFGNEVEIDVFGTSAMSIPNEAASPIAYAELGIEASFKPATGVMALSARLDPSSYVLSQDCHLTGGYAFYAWFKDTAEGANAGEFVVTLGGYHPAFQAPSYYPVEPRLEANWQVSSNLTVKGDFYFALTPHAVMAGGALDATWESSDVSAWFSAYADFLLCWKPFHYEADIGISLGASVTVDLGITSFTLTLHVGVDLEFHGPSFAGTATVDVYVCSITLHFGDSSPDVQPIPWTDFKQSFLPAPSGYCFTRASGGLLKDLTASKVSANDYDWVIQPEQLELTTFTIVPAKSATLSTGQTTTPAPNWAQDFGIGPSGVADADFTSHHAVTLTRIEPAMVAGEVLAFTIEPATKNLPAATWSAAVSLAPGLATLNNGKRMIADALTGLVLRPTVPEPDSTPLAIDIARLQMTTAQTQRTLSWPKPAIATSDSYGAPDWTKVATILEDTTVAGRRSALLAALQQQGLGVASVVNVTQLASQGQNVMLAPPLLRTLGEEAA